MDFGAALAFHQPGLTFLHISTTRAIARSHQLMMVMRMKMTSHPMVMNMTMATHPMVRIMTMTTHPMVMTRNR